ncbi:MAG: diguanylate cyclase [Coriobacteriia bacterium]|nr:diguanylate cyclase [Coriobacteriia bacterium]
MSLVEPSTDGGFDAPSTQPEPLIRHSLSECPHCWGCVRWCPAHAIHVVGGVAEIDELLCVKCGMCVTGCSSGNYIVRDDVPQVCDLLASGVPVVAMLASEYIAALYPRTPESVELELLDLGFSAIETTVLGEELVAAAYERAMTQRAESDVQLRSTCAVAVSWVQQFHPGLVGALVPIVSPYVAHARLVKALYPQGTAVVYVAPCWARKDEARRNEFADAIDAAIGFDELLRMLDGVSLPEREPETSSIWRPQSPKEISLTDGFPRQAFAASGTYGSGDLVVVRGLKDIDDLLAEIERGDVAPGMVDMLCCDGCIDGPATNPALSVHAKRSIVVAERESQPRSVVDSRELLGALPEVELARVFSACPASSSRTLSPEQIDDTLAAIGFADIDCGACGYDTCVEHAAAVCLGVSSWELCFPAQRKLMDKDRAELTQNALSDPLTGLGNRRLFDERLAEEVARAERYGSPLSLIMGDLDGFKGINDGYGHLAGDAVLDQFGVLLRAELRVSDIASRYGGDEFAILLPDTTKTDAWAVAEKLRAALSGQQIDVGDERRVRVTSSFGVAALGEVHATARDLIAAADTALYRAKHGGRNRVEIALG